MEREDKERWRWCLIHPSGKLVHCAIRWVDKHLMKKHKIQITYVILLSWSRVCVSLPGRMTRDRSLCRHQTEPGRGCFPLQLPAGRSSTAEEKRCLGVSPHHQCGDIVLIVLVSQRKRKVSPHCYTGEIVSWLENTIRREEEFVSIFSVPLQSHAKFSTPAVREEQYDHYIKLAPGTTDLILSSANSSDVKQHVG